MLLPISPFSETAGTFVNCEGRAQSFNGTVKPLGETRPAWKVLRVLGNLLGLSGFDYETSESIRDEVLGKGVTDLSAKLNNVAKLAPTSAPLRQRRAELERLADVPIYFADAIARRSEPLLRTADAQAPLAHHARPSWPSAGRASRRPGHGHARGRAASILVAAIDAAPAGERRARGRRSRI